MKNPLNIPQRETAGSSSFENFDYQYHYALYWLLEKSKENNDIAVFIEYHNDVVLAENLDPSQTQFYFAQVKANDGHLTLNEIIKNGKNNSPSILNKLCPTADYKPLLKQIQSIELVSANGFNFLSEHTHFRQLDKESKRKIINKLSIQLQTIGFLRRLSFKPANLAKTNIDSVLIGEIDKLVERLYPDTNRKSHRIYQTLIEDLHKKGKRRDTYINWEDALDNKSLSFNQVETTIKHFTQIADEYRDEAYKMFEYIKPDDLDPNEIIDFKKAIKQYSVERLATRSISSYIREYLTEKELTKFNKRGKFNFIEIEKYAIILARKLKISYKGHYKPLIISGIIYEYIYFRHNSS
ncbi:dsDNA nuclease domain-containing protein [Actinobacillus minor]|uniref:dsDNA nuclease domain-containing protein n=1 Tax=Actinobacillus minor TaxID=51047 RepID=UPI0023F21436|nr:dsDNA nuclease domain-containing protein [Actinobacillus minor]MDD6911275.1 dsDNA nuclease domain-containing protein [Actinobacillus minor]MDY4713539.1 dsDNA nuclease domain-containing protein [Actinobacillus minor]